MTGYMAAQLKARAAFKAMHASYLEHSPAYAATFDIYGPTMPRAAAESTAEVHSTTLEQLIADNNSDDMMDLSTSGPVGTLQLFMALGY